MFVISRTFSKVLCDTSLLGYFLSYEESVVNTAPGPKDIHTCQWRSIIFQHNARWHHVSLLKASVFCSSQKQYKCKQNTSACTRDGYCHLGSDGASFRGTHDSKVKRVYNIDARSPSTTKVATTSTFNPNIRQDSSTKKPETPVVAYR